MTEDNGKWISEDAAERCKSEISTNYKIQTKESLYGGQIKLMI
jgi:hypothetical protein